jgi:hypothetical protein
MVDTPFYLLVVTYAGIQLFLHMEEHILRGMTLSLSLSLSLSLLLTSLSSVLLL